MILRFLLLLALLTLTACGSEQPKYPSLGEGTVVLAFGDSITHGTGARSGEDYPSVLAQRTGWQLVNAGLSGDTADRARGRIAPLLDKHAPGLVIIELGGNDFLRKQSASLVKEFLREIVKEVKARDTLIVLIAVPGLSIARASFGALKDSPIYAELAKEEGLVLFEDQLSDILSDDALRADRIHPNAQGYELLAIGLDVFLADIGLH